MGNGVVLSSEGEVVSVRIDAEGEFEDRAVSRRVQRWDGRLKVEESVRGKAFVEKEEGEGLYCLLLSWRIFLCLGAAILQHTIFPPHPRNL